MYLNRGLEVEEEVELRELPQGLTEPQVTGPVPRVPDSLGLEWG